MKIKNEDRNYIHDHQNFSAYSMCEVNSKTTLMFPKNISFLKGYITAE